MIVDQASSGSASAPDFESKKVEFFGGALVADLNKNFSDMSSLVPIPDNQEVYQFLTEQDQETSVEKLLNFGQLIVEILEINEQ